jgi:CBS-domain-containing membrane protein
MGENRGYFSKMLGRGQAPERVGMTEVVWSWAGAFLGIGLVGGLNDYYVGRADLVLIIGSFGASAVLIYGAISSPLAQPRNLVGGHVISGLIGVAMYQNFGDSPWLAAALAVSLAIAAMHLTKTLHPPGGATALIAIVGSDQVHALGYFFAVVPVALGALLMLVVALVVNNIPRDRYYPMYWW